MSEQRPPYRPDIQYIPLPVLVEDLQSYQEDRGLEAVAESPAIAADMDRIIAEIEAEINSRGGK